MTFRTTEVQFLTYPTEPAFKDALSGFNLLPDEIREVIAHFECRTPRLQGDKSGYQQNIAKRLVDELTGFFQSRGCTATPEQKYSRAIGEKCDLLVVSQGGLNAYVEIEFRPNVEKDILKFEIAWRKESLALAVLIVAIDHKGINSNYGTMPKFSKVARVLEEFQPEFPLMLIGIDGKECA